MGPADQAQSTAKNQEQICALREFEVEQYFYLLHALGQANRRREVLYEGHQVASAAALSHSGNQGGRNVLLQLHQPSL